MRLVQNDPADHGAAHAADDDEQPDAARVLLSTLKNNSISYIFPVNTLIRNIAHYGEVVEYDGVE